MSDRVAGVPPFPPGYRASGVLLHVTSLPSAYGIGDLGPGAFAWVDRLDDAGQTWWPALPLGLVDVKVCAIDAVWSGLKLVIRRENRGKRRPG